jgi:hypothetical protein
MQSVWEPRDPAFAWLIRVSAPSIDLCDPLRPTLRFQNEMFTLATEDTFTLVFFAEFAVRLGAPIPASAVLGHDGPFM